MDKKQFIETLSKELFFNTQVFDDIGEIHFYDLSITAGMVKDGCYTLPADRQCYMKITIAPFVQCTLLDGVDSSRITYRIITIDVGEGASVAYDTQNRLDSSVKKYQFFEIVVQKGGAFSQKAWQSGGLVQASAYRCFLQGTGASILYTGRVHAQDQEIHQLFFSQIHIGSSSKSQVEVKAVVDGQSRCRYEGTISIKEGAFDSEAHQHHTAITLSPDAQVTAIPNLEVLTHKVACGHGAAVAHIDDDHLFYLQSRAIPFSHARALIIEGFLSL